MKILSLFMSTSRRQLIKWGAGLGISAAMLKLTAQAKNVNSSVRIPPLEKTDSDLDLPYNPMSILREFDYGTIKKENGRNIREFKVFARNDTLQLNSAITFVSWNLNDRIPGPTLRAKEGDRVRVIFHNEDGHSHSMHFHGNHPVEMDGVKPVRLGKTTIYEFDAEPYGVHPYHCHVAPVTRHIGKGLYGLFIVDPPHSRPPADEIEYKFL